MRNNVYSDIFWYGDTILPVWAKNQYFSKFHYNTYEKLWGHDIINSLILIFIRQWSRNASCSKCEMFKMLTHLFVSPKFSSIFAPIYRETNANFWIYSNTGLQITH